MFDVFEKVNNCKVKRIAFVGTHNTGKDTLSHFAFTYLKLKKKTVYYIAESAERAFMQKININDIKGQYWLVAHSAQQEIEAMMFEMREYVICNRAVFDNVAYQLEIDRSFAQKMLAFDEYFLRLWPYTAIIFCRPFETIFDDGLRSLDKNYQARIDENLYNIAKKLTADKPDTFFVLDDIDVNSRIEKLKTILDIITEKVDSTK